MDIKKFFTKNKNFLPSRKKKVKIKIQSDKNKYILILRILSILLMILLTGFIISTIIFVQKNVMGTITQIQFISAYDLDLHVELVDFNRLEKIEKKWAQKTGGEIEKINRNPFMFEIITEPVVSPIFEIPTTTPDTTEKTTSTTP